MQTLAATLNFCCLTPSLDEISELLVVNLDELVDGWNKLTSQVLQVAGLLEEKGFWRPSFYPPQPSQPESRPIRENVNAYLQQLIAHTLLVDEE